MMLSPAQLGPAGSTVRIAACHHLGQSESAYPTGIQDPLYGEAARRGRVSRRMPPKSPAVSPADTSVLDRDTSLLQNFHYLGSCKQVTDNSRPIYPFM